MAYTPPTSPFNLDFTAAGYIAPAGNAILLDFNPTPGALGAIGFGGETFGTVTIYDALQFIAPSGIAAGAFGSATVVNLDQFIVPPGFAAGGIGSHTVFNEDQFLLPSGIPSGGFGTLTIIDRDQTVIPVGFTQNKLGFNTDGTGAISHLIRNLAPAGRVDDVFGSQLVQDQNRNIAPPHYDATTYGTALVALNPRFILPNFIPATSYGTPKVDRDHFVTPSGFGGETFGTQFVHDNRQFPQIEGFADDAFGLAFVSHSPRVLLPQGFPSTNEYTIPSERWGLPEIHSNLQFLTQLFVVTPSDGGVFGDYLHTFVENRNREIGSQGWRSDRFGSGASVLNNARALEPDGLDATLWGNNLVAWRNRPLPVPAIAPGQIGEYTVVFNNARLLQPPGAVQTLFGLPSVVNTRRYYQNITGGDQSAFGDDLVAFRIRTLTVAPGPESLLGTPDVELQKRYVSPVAIDPYYMPPDFGGQWGLADLEIHRNIAYPTSLPFHPDTIGFPTVLNRNREVDMYGLDQSEWGRPIVYNKIQYLVPGMGDISAFGNSPVAYRNRSLGLFGFNSETVGPHTTVAKTTPDPPFTINVFETGFDASSYGTAAVRPNSIYPTGWDDSFYGSPTVRPNSIFPSGIVLTEALRFGLPAVIGPQYVTLDSPVAADGSDTGDGIMAPDDPHFPSGHSKPRVDPYTIWATFSASGQAIANNGNAWEAVDTYLNRDRPLDRPFFGSATVTNFNRSFAATGFDAAIVSNLADVENRRRKITPVGFVGARMGIPATNGPQFIDLTGFGGLGYGFTDEAIGRPTVDYYYAPGTTRSWAIQGFDDTAFGTTQIDLFNRTILGQGWDSFTITPPSGGQPYGPVLSTRVHFAEPIKPVGTDMSVFGFDEGGQVAYRIRQVFAEGFDAYEDGYTEGDFTDRLRVTHGPGSIAPHGWDSLAIGGDLKVRARNTITAIPGFEAGQVGDNRITHDVFRELFPDGIDDGAFGVATGSYGDGADFVCGQRPRAIPPQGFTQNAFGTHGVAHG